MAEKYLVREGDDELAFELRREDGRTFVRREGNDAWREAELQRAGESGLYVLMLDNQPIELYMERRRGGAIVTIGRHIFDYDIGPWRPAGARQQKAGGSKSGESRVTAPMTGSIVEIRCAPGDSVEAGQVLLVIESMKMNNELRSPVEGTVDSVPVKPGQRVNAGDLLVALRAGGA